MTPTRDYAANPSKILLPPLGRAPFMVTVPHAERRLWHGSQALPSVLG